MATRQVSRVVSMLAATMVAATAGVSACASSTYTLDGFTEGPTYLEAGFATAIGANLSAPSVPGGVRSVSAVCGLPNGLGNGLLMINTNTGRFEFNSDGSGGCYIGYGYTYTKPAVSGVYASGMAIDSTNPLNADWSDYQAIRIPIIDEALAMNIQVTVGNSQSTWYALSSQAGNLDIPFTAFTGVNWSDVDSMEIAAATDTGGGVEFGSIQLVPAAIPAPTPTSLSSAGLILFLMGGWTLLRRRAGVEESWRQCLWGSK